jgi:hypothetical protein
MSSVSSFFEKRIMRRSQDAAAPPTPSAPIPSPSPANSPPPATPPAGPAVTSAPPAPTPLATAVVPPANESTPPAPPPIAPPTPRLDARGGPPTNPAAKGGPRTLQPRALENVMPDGIPRNSRLAGPCIGGVGGCYWGGGRY